MSNETGHAAMGVMNEETAEELLGGGSLYFDYLTTVYLSNLLKNTNPTSPVAYQICSTFVMHNETLEGLENWPAKKNTRQKQQAYPQVKRPKSDQVKKDDWDRLVNFFKDKLAKFSEPPPSPATFKNIEKLAENLSLKPIETEILKLFYLRENDFMFAMFADSLIREEKTRTAAALARFLDHPKEVEQIKRILDPASSFTRYGIVTVPGTPDEEGDCSPYPEIEEGINGYINLATDNGKSMVESIIGKPYKAELDIDDFSYLSEDIDQILSIIENSVKNQKPGINILLYGPAGSGKTELSKAIAKKLNFTLYGIGEDVEEDAHESTAAIAAKKRVAKLFQAHAFLQGKKDVILLFDEVEDLLLKGTDSNKKAEPPSKIIVNRLLENNPVVTIWAGNDPEKFHESMRQRFTYSVYVDYPPTAMREKIWQKQLALKGATLPSNEVRQLAREYLAPARMIATAIANAGTGVLKKPAIERFLHASSRLTYGDIEAIESGAGLSDKFDIDLINYEAARQNEMGSIMADGKNARPYAILAQGQAGSGLRSFGRFMAEKTIINHAEHDMRALLAANPMSPPEANIKGAFESARNKKQLLVFSHMDAFAADPGNDSSPDWRNGLTSLFMECLMNHSMPVIAHTYNTKTKFPEFIGECFSLRLNISPLTQEQSAKAMASYFPQLENSSEKVREFPSGLVPADFARVAKIFQRSTNGHTSATKIIEMLEKQPTYRQHTSGKIGFGTR